MLEGKDEGADLSSEDDWLELDLAVSESVLAVGSIGSEENWAEKLDGMGALA